MPQLIGLVLVGAGLWAGVKALQRVAERAAAGKPEHPETNEAGARPREKDLGRLEPDPRTGIYRPVGGGPERGRIG